VMRMKGEGMWKKAKKKDAFEIVVKADEKE
jgi:hypothetical protein